MYHINLISSIICCLRSGGMYISFGITSSMCTGVIDLLGDFCDASLRALCDVLVAGLVVFLSIKSPIALYEAVVGASVADCLT